MEMAIEGMQSGLADRIRARREARSHSVGQDSSGRSRNGLSQGGGDGVAMGGAGGAELVHGVGNLSIAKQSRDVPPQQQVAAQAAPSPDSPSVAKRPDAPSPTHDAHRERARAEATRLASVITDLRQRQQPQPELEETRSRGMRM